MHALYWNTVDLRLRMVLEDLMAARVFNPFRLVGGTALSLQLGHRRSVDIDLFTDHAHGTIDFEAIDCFLGESYPYVSIPTPGPIGFGRSYFVGKAEQTAIKLDIYYTDTFIRTPFVHDGVRMANTAEIAAMKMDIIQRGGRKKDFWDVHELLDVYSLKELMDFHAERYPYDRDQQRITEGFTNFDRADDDFDPVCLRGKYWELIKLDLLETVQG